MSQQKITSINLIGQDDHKQFLELQAAIGIAQRGGSTFYGPAKHEQRLVSDVNLLTSGEKRKLIFSEFIFSN
ncbi:MAG: hypothetical protein ACXVP0_08850 [Bacteroidia bacterium]